MKKRILSVLLTMAMVLSMLPVMGPAVLAAGTAEKEIDQSTYEALGLNLYSDENAAADSVTAPFKEDGVATSIAAREVYVALNAAHGNRYTLRDGLDTVDPNIHDNTRDQHSGAYAFYGGSPSSIKAENGSTVSSGLSSNKGENVLASQGNGFNGIYATSVALDGGDGKDNYVAELRAYGDTTKTTYNSKEYGGGLKVVVFQIGDDGSRTEAATLTPKLNDSSVYSNSVAYLTRRYVQELDAYFEIEAGDLNGDGLDDLAVYTGRYKDVDGRRYALVDVFYATGSGQWQTAPSQEIAVDAGDASSYSKISYSQAWKGEIVKHPVVTIAMGDIDRNLKDEMAVVSSAPANNNDADNVAHFSLLGYEDGKLSPVGEMENVALNDGNGSGLISAGCAFGEFAQIDNESASATTLIIGGWSAGSSVITRNEASAGYSQGAYYYVYYDYTTGQYIQSGYRSKDLGGHTKSISQVFNLEGQENGGNGVRVYPTLAPMAVACGDLDGSKVQSVSDQVLFGTQVMEFSLETGFGSELFSFDFCMTQVDDKNNNRDKEQPWIGDVVVGTVDSDPSKKGWREMFLFVTGVHRKSEINTSDDYYYMDLGAIWRRETASETDAKEGYFILFEGVMAKSNARNDTYGTFVSLALPDVGNDSVVMKFVDKGIIYTDPEVFAVLQASPYFSDLEEVYGYIGNGGTSYGESQGSSTTGGASISGSYGFYHSATVQAVAAAEYEFSLVATASYDYSYSSDKETAISYNNQAGGGDKVVVYTVPNVLYIYEVYTPGTSGASGTWDQVVMTTPLQAVVTMLDVDAYDEVAASTAGLEPVRGNILYSTPGQPETYVNKPAGQQEVIYDTYAQSSSAGSGSDITQEFSFSETNEHSFSVGFDFNFKVGAGGGGLGNELMFGAMGNIAASGSGGWSRTEGTSFSGTVDALPEEATNYGFSWRLLVNQATLGGNDVWVVGYDVKDVVQPPRMPQNLTVTQVGTDYVDLEWESGGNASSYILYQKTTTGNYNQVAVLPYTAESYRHEGRNPNTTYTYIIQAISSSGAGSIYSPDVTATTMADNASFSIVEHPGDAHAHAGGSAQFEAQGSGQGGYGVVGYEWQVNETGRAADWKKLSGTGVAGASSAKLTLNNVTQEMDGWQYRCRIYYDQYELFTAPATLIVNKADSQITMSILDGNSQVTGNIVLSAKGSVVTTSSSEVSGKKAVSVTTDDKTYTLLSGTASGQTCYYWFDGSNYYAYAGQLPTVSDGLFGTDAVFSEANVGDQQTLTATDYTTTIAVGDNGRVEVSLSEPTEVTGDAITIPDPEGTSEAPGTPYTAARKWTVTTDGYASYTVYEATRTVEGKEETETFYTADNSNYTVCTVTYTNVITVSEGVTLDVSTLATAFQATTSSTTTTQTHTSDGKAYTLTAAPKALAGSASIDGADNRVYFSISNGISGETVDAAWNPEQNCYTATWTPTLTGKLTITAVFAGNDLYLSSQSDPYTVYSTVQVKDMDTSSLSMSAPANMLYGQAGTLAVTKLTVDTQSHASSADVTTASGTTYTVEKRDTSGEYKPAAANTDYTLNGDSFTPLAVSTFRITATNDFLTASAVISAGKATLTLAAQDSERAVNGSEREPADVTITTNNGQTVSLTKNIDYTLTSDGTTATIPGTYPIQVALKNTSAVQNLQANYNIITQGATYTLTSEAYQVTATAGANGSVSVSYQADSASATVPVQSGTSLPEGSQVTVTATPDNGYMVSRWMVNGKYVTASGSASYYTGTTYSIDSLDQAYTISVEFALGSSTLTYGAANADGAGGELHGQVTAWYVEGGVQGNQCASGNAVNYNQTVRVAAQPDEGYAVHHWTVQKGNGEPQILMAPDGVSYFTGESNDFSQFSEDMVVTVYFTKEETLPVTIKPVDNDSEPLVNAVVTVNGEQLTWDEVETAFVYQGKTGENLTITVTPPSGVLVQEWTVGKDQTTGSLSNQNQTMTLYNLQGETNFTVKCAALNTFQVTFSGAMEGGAFSNDVGTVTAAKIGVTGTGLTSGEKQAQGSAILFTATAKDGYEIAGWTVNGETVEANGAPNSQTYQIPSLSSNVNVVATFRAKPQVTIPSISNTQSVTVTGTVNGVADQTVISGGYVDYGTALTVTVTPEDSHVVTKICNTAVNEAKANGAQSTTITNVTSAQTISAELTAKPTVSITQLANGTITVTGTVNGQSDKTVNNGGYVDYGTGLTVTVTPENSHVVTKICDTAVNEAKANGAQSTTITNVTSAQTVSAELTAKPKVTITKTDNGTVTLTGTVNGVADRTVTNGGYVDFGTEVMASAVPGDGYVADTINSVAVNADKTNGAKSSALAVPDDGLTVSATFLAKPKVTFTQPAGGALSVKGTVDGKETSLSTGSYVDFASTLIATATPDNGYVVETINSKNLNEDKENGPKSDTLAVPDDGLTVGATFLAKPTVTIDTVAGGAVEATGTADGLEKPLVTGDYVDFGTDVEVALGPDKGYVVGNDGTDYVDEDKSDDKTYTISNIHANQSIVPIWNRLATYAIGFSVVDLTGDGQGNGGKLSAVVARKGMADYDQSISADVSGSAIVYNGGTITLTAAAESGYRVKEWTINGQVYKTNGDAYTGSTLTLTPKENQTITVQFQLGDPTVTFGDPDHGSLTAVTDAGTAFTSGGATKVAVNFTVTPDAGYEVKQWTVNGTVQKQDGQIITANTFSIKPQGDVVVAVELQGVVMNVTATAGPGGSASVSPEIVRYGDTVTFTATANTGFTFDGWYVDGSKVEDAEGTTYIVPNVTADMALEARFTATADNQVEFSVNDETMGAITATANDQPISSGDMLAGGTKVVFTVSPEPGYRVADWIGLPDDAEISADKTTATVAALPGELTVQAVLEVIPMHTVTIETPEHGAITATANGQPISSGDTVPDGTQVTFTATPDSNWIFSAWTGAAASQSDKTFTMAVTGDITVGVAFEEAIHYVVHYSVVGNAGGTLSGTADGQIVVADTDVQVVGGSELVFTAVPDEGKAVKEWTVNGQAQDTLSNTLTIDSLSETTTVTVEFEELVFFDLPEDTAEYTITDITKDPADYGEDREIRKGGDVTFQVAPVQGKAITTLTVNSGSASQNADGSWTVTVEDVQDHITLNVTLISGVSLIIKEPVNGTITVKRGENTLNSGAALQANDQLVITASADSGYALKNLTVNGVTITSGGTYTVTGEEQAVTVEATFDEKPSTGGGGGGGAGGGAGGGGNVEPGHGILVTPSDNGILIIDPDNAQDGTDVTVTAEPEEGYELIHVTVTDGDGQSVTVTEQEDGSFTFVMPDSEVTVEGFFALIDSADCPRNEECPLYVYEDVNINAWYHDALHYCVDRGLMQGIGGGMFAPDMTTSRAMIVTMLYRLEGEPQITGEIDFADVPMDSWYGQAVAWAAANDIVKGYGDKTFGPEDAVTREQVVSILYRYAGYKGYNLDGQGTLNEFRDGDQVSSWATEAMLWALDKGVVSGKGDGILDPTGDATRAEIGQIFMNGIRTLPGSTHS